MSKKFEQFKAQVKANYFQAKADGCSEAVLMSLHRSSFKAKIQYQEGFGTQDLKKDAFEKVQWIVNKYGQKVIFRPVSRDPRTFQVDVLVKI